MKWKIKEEPNEAPDMSNNVNTFQVKYKEKGKAQKLRSEEFTIKLKTFQVGAIRQFFKLYFILMKFFFPLRVKVCWMKTFWFCLGV